MTESCSLMTCGSYALSDDIGSGVWWPSIFNYPGPRQRDARCLRRGWDTSLNVLFDTPMLVTELAVKCDTEEA